MRRMILGFVWVALVLGLGCQGNRPAIVRVQANVMEKTVLSGEWYFMQTVVDTPYSVGFTFVGEQGPLQKIRWEIQEHYLIARRSYEHVAGSEGQGVLGPGSERGSAIAMYAIEKHFDIRREYNETTGEETNVIVENEDDRRWYERQFMRVDWSKNLITDVDFMSMWRLFNGVTAEPVAYDIDDPRDPRAPQFIRDPESGEIAYMDIVNKVFVTPEQAYIEGWGDIPACWLVGSEHLDCVSGEVTFRNSFLRVDPGHDYQPMAYTGDRMDRFGYFVNERAGFDPEYGVVDPARFRFINRHNIWEQSHRRDAHGAYVACTSNADCDDGRGSACDMDLAHALRTETGACTVAYRDRHVRQVAYHLTENFPEDLDPDARHLTEQWNGAFVETVASLRENECLSYGGSADECAAERTRADGQSVFVLCHGPVRADDPQSCGARGTVANIGDLRYSVIGWVNEPHSDSPLGYGPSAADPETGELINGSAFIYGAGVETLSAWGRDLLAMLNGDVTQEELSSGRTVADWVEHMQAPTASRAPAREADEHAIAIDGEDVERIGQAMDFSWVRGPAASRSAPPPRPRNASEMRDRVQEAVRRIARRGGYGAGDERGDARLQSLRGTAIERMMTTPEMRVAGGLDPRLALDERGLEAASPLRGLSLRRMGALQEARRRMRAAGGCVLDADFMDTGLLGLARSIKTAIDRGDGTVEWYGETYDVRDADGRLDYEAVRRILRHPIFEATTAHEVGHTIGLRHNFAASGDAINYGHRYWELRDDGDMQPRAWDPISEAEIDGRQREYQYSSVMDYGNNYLSTDAMGLGHYDRAAIKMGYGDLVEVWTNVRDTHEAAWISFIENAGWGVMLKESTFERDGELAAYRYTDVPGVLGGIDRLEQRADVPYTSLRAEARLAMDGVDDPVVDASNRPVVPYRFCSDEISDLDSECMLYDAGADPYESMQSVIDQYFNYYVLNAFRRGRLTFNIDDYYERIYERFLVKLQYNTQSYALSRSYFEEAFATDPSLSRFFTRPDGYGAWTLSVGASFQALTRVITTPSPGDYGEADRGDGTTAMLLDAGQDLRLDPYTGRDLETTWDFDQGFFWFDQIARAGYFYDKVIALEVMMDPETAFVGKDTAADVRTYALNFQNVFPDAVTSFMRGVIGEDWATIGPRRDGRDGLTYPDPLQLVDRGMPGSPVDPDASFTIQLYAAVFGMALSPETYDRTYFDRSRVFVRGSAESVELAPTAHTVEFTDPSSGLVYVAASYPDGTGRETGIGAQMLLHARLLNEHRSSYELDRYMDAINVARELSWELGL